MKIYKGIRISAAVMAGVLGGTGAQAADGTWIQIATGNASGSWNTATNWSGSTIADGSGFNANFNTLDITTTSTVTLDAPRTIGSLTFGDTSPGTTAVSGWVLNAGTGTPALTLAGGTPTITVNALGTSSGVANTVRINAVLAGTAGLVKAGTGQLILNGNNTYTGTTTINAGNLTLGAGAGTGTVTGDILINATNATLQLDQGVANTMSNTITGTGAVLKTNGAGSVTLTGNNTYSGGTTLNAGGMYMGTGTNNGIGTGTFNFNGGRLGSSDNAARTINNVMVFNGSSGAIAFGAAQGLTTGLGDLTFTDTSSQTAPTGTNAFTVNNSTRVSIAKTFTGGSTNRIFKAGNGTLILTGANTYTGTTTVNGGTLLINGSLGNSAVTVATTATLGGTGTINGTVAVNGSLAPGDGLGTLTVANDVTWNGTTGENWKFQLGVTSGSSDQLLLTGSGNDFLKGTGSVFAFDFLNTGVAGTFTLVDWSDLASTTFNISDFTYTGLGSGLTGSFAFNGSSLQFTAVPEPSTYALLGLGLVALVFLRRKSAKQA